jgi:hypothetical protein
MLDKAHRERDLNKFEELYGEWDAVERLTFDSLAVLESSELIRKANKYHLSPLDIEAPKPA